MLSSEASTQFHVLPSRGHTVLCLLRRCQILLWSSFLVRSELLLQIHLLICFPGLSLGCGKKTDINSYIVKRLY